MQNFCFLEWFRILVLGSKLITWLKIVPQLCRLYCRYFFCGISFLVYLEIIGSFLVTWMVSYNEFPRLEGKTGGQNTGNVQLLHCYSVFDRRKTLESLRVFLTLAMVI